VTVESAPPARRLPAEVRRRSILRAARRAFSETGDANGTTIKVIAQYAEISTGMIYQLFESKEQLFHEAVVEPLREAVDDLVAAAEIVDRDEPLTHERRLQTLNGLYRQLVATLKELAPLLGLVLFGDPHGAQRFYIENLAVAMDRLGKAWSDVEARHGRELQEPDITARAIMGTALILALESHHGKAFDLPRGVAAASHGSLEGFFPVKQGRTRPRRVGGARRLRPPSLTASERSYSFAPCRPRRSLCGSTVTSSKSSRWPTR
jgi:AcrR family transcriptional regulator